ncbi:hypothetical protein H6F32_00395 [Anabaena sp. FACHB-1237]|uniref:hypothetical protein n=1 Tax=Anabaena sp. FACHB-1237 TaxID=2692769 RepID=UPI001680EE59|nr:hypothetical protein [Anabaena sp. FACHB-1237]MBD2136076.1 hypothetical protein [Anabaena sp. FACHB-1237]
MLKHFFVSGWFRLQPFVKYVFILIMLSPLAGESVNSIAAKQLEKGNIKVEYGKSRYKWESSIQQNSSSPQEVLKFNKYFLLNEVSLSKGNTVVEPIIKDNNQTGKYSGVKGTKVENSSGMFEAIQLKILPSQKDDKSSSIKSNRLENNHSHTSEELKDPQRNQPIQGVDENSNSQALPNVRVLPNNARGLETPVNEQITTDQPPENGEMVQNDPIGSPHPIPWQWIMKTQENVGGKGNSGVRYYRSIPVVSTDGRYAIYSRVEMTVKPEMHNSRVNSALFIEDRKTKQLKVLLTTNQINDPLLKKQEKLTEEMPEDGKIAVLVPVSWSKTGDRFLARKFVALFNTADATDQAVIWHRQHNQINTIAPHQEQEDREKIAILLGWSKNEPNSVLFRSGELGEENWPLVQVNNDGKTIELAAEADQAVTFGNRGKIWADPQLASR